MKKQKKFMANVQQLFRRFEEGRWYREANSYLNDKDKMCSLLGLVAKMFRNRALAPVLRDLVLLYYYTKDVVKGRYKGYSPAKLVLIVAVLIYVVTPFDLVPDWIPAAGFLDDAALLGYVVQMADKELQRYHLWSKKNRESQTPHSEACSTQE